MGMLLFRDRKLNAEQAQKAEKERIVKPAKLKENNNNQNKEQREKPINNKYIPQDL